MALFVTFGQWRLACKNWSRMFSEWNFCTTSWKLWIDKLIEKPQVGCYGGTWVWLSTEFNFSERLKFLIASSLEKINPVATVKLMFAEWNQSKFVAVLENSNYQESDAKIQFKVFKVSFPSQIWNFPVKPW